MITKPCKWFLIGIVLLLCTFIGVVWYVAFRRVEEKHWSVEAEIGQRHATVDIVWSCRPGILLGHQYLIESRGYRYDVTVTFDDGSTLRFDVPREPLAIWPAESSYYVVCYSVGRGWHAAELTKDGTVRHIGISELPTRDFAWNLVRPEARKEYEEDFEMWAR